MKNRIMSLVATAAILATTPAFCMMEKDQEYKLNVRVRYDPQHIFPDFDNASFLLFFGKESSANPVNLDFTCDPETKEFNTHSIRINHEPRDPIVLSIKPDDKFARVMWPNEISDKIFQVAPLGDLNDEQVRREIIQSGKTVCLKLYAGYEPYTRNVFTCTLFTE